MTDLTPWNAITGSASALILAGGAGRRVNGQDKGLLDWRGKPLIDHVLARIRPQVNEVYISCNRNRDRYRERATLTPGDLRSQFQGPLAGIEAAITTLQADYILLAPCDMPELPNDLFERLVSALHDDDTANAAYVTTANAEHYLCAVLRGRCLASLPGFLDAGGRAVRSWYREIGAQPVSFQDRASQFTHINHLSGQAYRR